MNNVLTSFLVAIAYQVPLILVQIVGIVLALVNWKRYPGPCLLAVLAFTLLILTGLVQTCFNIYLFRVAREDWNWNYEQINNLSMVVNIIAGLVRAGGMLMLVLAIFSGRSAMEARRRDYD